MADNMQTDEGLVVTGSSVEDAVKRALLQLDASLDEVDVDVLHTGSRGVLGLGGEDARVRVRFRNRPAPSSTTADTAHADEPTSDEPVDDGLVDDGPVDDGLVDDEPIDDEPIDDEPIDDELVDDGLVDDELVDDEPIDDEPIDDAQDASRDDAANLDEDERGGAPEDARDDDRALDQPPPRDDAPPTPERPFDRRREMLDSGEDLERETEDLLAGLLDRMGFMADFELVSEAPLGYNIVGDDDFEPLIGYQGETLRSFGYIVNLCASRRMGRPCRVLIDVNGYLQRRAEHLAELAASLADEVRDTQEPLTLEAMPPNERRLVHVALADDDDVRTYSIGEGDDRRVVISPKA